MDTAGGLDPHGRSSTDTSIRDVRRVLLCVVIAELILVIVLLKIVLHYMKPSTTGMPQEVTDDLKSDFVRCTTEKSDTNLIRKDACDQDLINLNDSQELPNPRTETGRNVKKVRELKQRNRYIHNYKAMGLQQPCDDIDSTGLYSSRELFGSTDSHVYETLSLSSDVSDTNTRLSSCKTSDMSTKIKKGKRAVTTLPPDFML